MTTITWSEDGSAKIRGHHRPMDGFPSESWFGADPKGQTRMDQGRRQRISGCPDPRQGAPGSAVGVCCRKPVRTGGMVTAGSVSARAATILGPYMLHSNRRAGQSRQFRGRLAM